MNRGPAVLVIEDETTLANNIAAYLRRAGFDVAHAADAEQGLILVESFRPDVILLDYSLPGMDGLQALTRIRAIDGRVKVIMITGHGNVRLAVDAMKASAYDYLAKPVALAEVRALIDRALGEERRDEIDAHNRRRAGGGLAALIGESAAIVSLKDTIRELVAAEASITGPPPPVLIGGETGTGKELVARAIHFEGRRAGRPFVEVNCGSIPANLLESELFGYERGAFTDARERKIGLIEAADGGTLFLDEIGDMDYALQVKLLRVLEEQVIRRLGSVRDRSVDVRIVSATNRPLEEMVAAAKFRSDLLFRLRIVSVHAPPLRVRGDDVRLLTAHFLQHFAGRYGKATPQLTPAAQEALRAHPWPGNVRELRNTIDQAVLLARGPVITPEMLRLPDGAGAAFVAPGPAAPASAGVRLEDVERATLLAALDRTLWNVSRAATLLGVSRDTLRYRMAKFGLQRPGSEAGAADAQ
jgi:two-component system, NtrC family, response regulator AtoC